jgi:L-alanine-DL-glutamate epimerase-like enolase superfamily enzyme
MTCKLLEADLGIINIHTRIPFRYGIAVMTDVPHLIVRARMEIHGQVVQGYSADNLAPKWFTKNPDESYEQEIADMLRVIRQAANFARQAGPAPTIFSLWEKMYQEQTTWGRSLGLPPLLTQFGTSLIERAMIDAFCRRSGSSFAHALDSGALGVRLDAIHPELGKTSPTDYLPPAPLKQIAIRHTVGMADPLDPSQLSNWKDDGQPLDLESVIRHYGVRYFKLKVGGNIAEDTRRLADIIAVIKRQRGDDFFFTIDGNEQYRSMHAVRELWGGLLSAVDAEALNRLIFIEQPIHRDAALTPEIHGQLEEWKDRPPIIIDESDAGFSAVRDALALGYSGTSHKNCKGVFKGIANACLLASRRRNSGVKTVLSGEDLSNVGPVGLLQDLTVMARLNVSHVERNGYHYMKGIYFLPEEGRQITLRNHPDLYTNTPDGYAALRIENGLLNIGSLQNPSLGMAAEFDFDWCIPENEWTFESLQPH